MTVIGIDRLAKDAYALYSSLLTSGFTDGHAMGIISQFLNHAYMQNILREEQEFAQITNKEV